MGLTWLTSTRCTQNRYSWAPSGWTESPYLTSSPTNGSPSGSLTITDPRGQDPAQPTHEDLRVQSALLQTYNGHRTNRPRDCPSTYEDLVRKRGVSSAHRARGSTHTEGDSSFVY
ncbi:hypothetical protein TNCT_625111 [Trichonephila clavata]|uniref:Uncharacterized protein n=1 Tax=Trichonephila clavata TaxID=2740835 RepID=A0A8X6LRL2_TRICU|nr:hypothetical protein TNCT_625111 [Trichonephila clavata]